MAETESEQDPNQYKDPGHPLIILIGGLAFFLVIIALAWIIPFFLTGQPDKSATNNFQQGPPLSEIRKEKQNTQSTAADVQSVSVAEGEMFIRPQSPQAKAGQVTFRANNQGQIAHELIVLKTDKPAAELGSGTTIQTTGLVGKIANIAPGKSKQLKLKLAAGHYALICNLPGHYTAGMHADLKVTS